MSLSIDGLISGMKTSETIDKLIAAEGTRQRALMARVSTTDKYISALQALNAKTSSLEEMAAKVAKADSWTAVAGKSSDKSVSVVAGAGAQVGSMDIRVSAVARSQVNLVSPTALGEGPLTITVGDQTYTVTPKSGSAQDLAKALSSIPESGLVATAVRVGGTDDAPEYTLQVTGGTGAAKSFSIATDDGTVIADSTSAISQAGDAALVLWEGTGAQRTVTSSTNTFKDLMDGVSISVTSVTADPVKISVEANTTDQKKLVNDLVSQLNQVLSEITSQTRTTTKQENGRPVVTGGALSGDTAARFLQQGVLEAASRPIGDVSPTAALGLSIGQDGTFAVDADVLEKALAEDPQAVAAFAQQLAARVETTANRASDKYEGSLTVKLQGQESLKTSLQEQVDAWDLRLDARRKTLTAQFTMMEKSLGTLKSQSNWLAGQIASLPGYSK